MNSMNYKDLALELMQAPVKRDSGISEVNQSLISSGTSPIKTISTLKDSSDKKKSVERRPAKSKFATEAKKEPIMSTEYYRD